VSVPPVDPRFDLTDDGAVDSDDLDKWLADAADDNGYASPYLRGDANLNRRVDISDFNTMATHFDPGGVHAATNTWSKGDFDGDGEIDITDFGQIAENFSPGGYDHAPGSGAAPGSGDTPASATAPASTDTPAGVADADPGQVDLLVNLATGEIALSGNAAAISGLQVYSAGGGLLPQDLAPEVLQFVIATNATAYAEGAFANIGVNGAVPLGALYNLSAATRDITFEYTMLGQATVTGNVVYVPEPLALAVLAGMGGLVAVRRRWAG